MNKNAVILTFEIIILAILWGLLVLSSLVPLGDYSYQHYREIQQIEVPACTLASVDEGGQVAPNGGIVCKETGQFPTEAQFNVWEGYVLWNSCYAYHAKYACDELGD